MFARLSWHLHPADLRKSMIQLPSMFLVSPLYGPLTRRNPALGGEDPLHGDRVERQEIEPAMVLELGAPVRDTARRAQGGRDLARVDGLAEERRAEEYRAAPVHVERDGIAGLLLSREGRRCRQWDAKARRRGRPVVRGGRGCTAVVLRAGEVWVEAALLNLLVRCIRERGRVRGEARGLARGPREPGRVGGEGGRGARRRSEARLVVELRIGRAGHRWELAVLVTVRVERAGGESGARHDGGRVWRRFRA